MPVRSTQAALCELADTTRALALRSSSLTKYDKRGPTQRTKTSQKNSSTLHWPAIFLAISTLVLELIPIVYCTNSGAQIYPLPSQSTSSNIVFRASPCRRQAADHVMRGAVLSLLIIDNVDK